MNDLPQPTFPDRSGLWSAIRHVHRHRWAAILCGVAVVLASVAAPAAETWTDSSGNFRIEAEFLGIRAADVYLKRLDGATIRVPLERLSAESRELARRLAMPEAPPATAADDGGPDAAVSALQAELEAGNLRALWDALPGDYQRDVHDLVHTFAASMDADLWKVGTGIFQRLVRLLKEKKEFLLEQPMLAQGPVDADMMGENWDSFVGVLDAIGTSDLVDLQKLKTLDVGEFLDGTGRKIAEQMAVLTKAADDKKLSLTEFPAIPVPAVPLAGLANAKLSTVRVEGDTAILRIESEDDTEDVEVVRVNGKWLPKEMVDGWSEQMESARAALAAMPETLKKNKLQILLPMQAVQHALDQLLAAETQAEFDKVIQEIIQLFLPAGMDGMGDQPAGPPPAGTDPFGE